MSTNLRTRCRRPALVLLVVLLGAVGGGCPGGPPDAVIERGGTSGKTSLAGKEPQEPGEEACASCHEEESRFWSYGGHAEIACEQCHRVQGNHVEAKEKPELPDNRACLGCHPLVEGPQRGGLSEQEVLERHLEFVEKKHVVKVDRQKIGDRCIRCHDPHLGQ